MSAEAPAVPGAIHVRPDGVRLTVRLTPRAARDALGRFERLSDGSEVMLAHVRALPSEGEANAALTALVAKAVGLAKSKVEVVSGRTSRVKILALDGPADEIAAALHACAAAANRP
ncbi:MAG: DUF167 family protein [Siculibacillus sp.]